MPTLPGSGPDADRPSNPDIFDISGRTALVTGSTRGIGRALATGLSRAGCTVIVHGRDADKAAAVATEISAETGTPTDACGFDITDPAAVGAGVEELLGRVGPIDILVNNAGVQHRQPFLELDPADFDKVIAGNLTASFLVAQKLAGPMAERGWGRIVNVGSLTSSLARSTIVPYATSKGGVAMLTRGMCAELAQFGVCVNAIAPGFFKTEMNQALIDDPEFDGWLKKRTPAGRWGEVDELVPAVRFLVSDAARFVNGQVIYVDGGFTAVM